MDLLAAKLFLYLCAYSFLCWAYWYITVPVGAFFVFMASRKKTKNIWYSICALFFLLPIILLPILAGGLLLFLTH